MPILRDRRGAIADFKLAKADFTSIESILRSHAAQDAVLSDGTAIYR